MSRRGPGHSSPYGQACLSCFKAKCKCVVRPDGNGCQRCHHLGKQCLPSESLRRQTIENNQSSNTRISKLESRLDGLDSLLRSLVKTPRSEDTFGRLLDKKDIQQQHIDTESWISNPVLRQDATGYDDDRECANAPPRSENLLSLKIPSLDSPWAIISLDPSDNEAESCLDLFRSQMLRHFGVVHLPADLTAQQLRWDRPFLFRAIVAVASPSVHDKVARGKELKRLLADMALDQKHNSMDLLLGLLTYIAWGWDNFLLRSGTSRLMSLAMSMVGEMRLNKPVPPDFYVARLPTSVMDHQAYAGQMSSQLYLERQRAVLGCFVLSSIISARFGQVDALRWTQHMEDGLSALSMSTNCQTDAALSFQVRLQLLVQNTLEVGEKPQLDQAQGGKTAVSTFPFINSLLGRLQALRASLSPTIQTHGFLMAHSYFVELSISQTIHMIDSAIMLMADPCPNLISMIDAGARTGSNPLLGVELVSCFWQSAHAINAYAENFLSLTPSEILGVSFIQVSQLFHCIVVLYRLTMLEDPAWDRAALRALVDLPILVGHLAERLELVAIHAGEKDPDDMYTKLAWFVRRFGSTAACGNGMTFEGVENHSEDAEWSAAREGSRTQSMTGMVEPFSFINDTMWQDEC